jgi:pimeloyl-ACP methyl ester carboxylesterase
MATLKLNGWETRGYGERSDGSVRSGDRDIDITVRRPHGGEYDLIEIMANGWTASKNSMRVPAIEAVKLGHAAVTLDYTNTGVRGALQHNVGDVVAVVRAMPKDTRKYLMGLSMGGAVDTMALEEVGADIERADLVAPGKFLQSDYYSRRRIAGHMLAEAAEILELRGNVRSGISLLSGGAANCIRRPQAIVAEIRELLDGNVHDHLRRVKAEADAPYIHFWYGQHDNLLPAHAQEMSVADLPFDGVTCYLGRHARLAYDPTLAQDIFASDIRSLAA